MFRYILILQCLVPLALCYSSGAPGDSCVNLFPGHGFNAKTGVSPVTLSGPAQVKAGSNVELTLDTDSTFRGFIIRAFEDTVGSTGKFLETTDMKQLTCDRQNDTATHDNGSDKPQVKLIWTAPNYPTYVTFNSTVVIDYSTIYRNEAIHIQVV